MYFTFITGAGGGVAGTSIAGAAGAFAAADGDVGLTATFVEGAPKRKMSL
jgi:hypothetical protein